MFFHLNKKHKKNIFYIYAKNDTPSLVSYNGIKVSYTRCSAMIAATSLSLQTLPQLVTATTAWWIHSLWNVFQFLVAWLMKCYGPLY